MGDFFERAITPDIPPRWVRFADLLVFTGVLLLMVMVLRYPEPRNAWRLVVIALTLLSLISLIGKDRSATIPLANIRLFALSACVFITIFIASFLGLTFEFSGRQFSSDFLIPWLLPILFWNTVTNKRRWEAMMYALAIAAIFLVLANFFQYLREWQQFGGLSKDVFLHRNYSVNLVFGMSFLILLGFSASFIWMRWVAWFLVVITLAMIVGTGARGAWLGAAIVIGIFGLITRNRTYLIVIFLGVLLAALASFAIIPSEFVAAKIQQGFDTSGRTRGTWGPAFEMAVVHPLLGYGFGDDVFHNEYNRLVIEKEHWPLKSSIGAHSFFLSLAFAAGFPAMISVLLLMLSLLFCVFYYIRLLRRNKNAHLYQWNVSGAALASSFFGVYAVMGLFENLSWTLFCLSLGLFLVWVRLVDADGGGKK